MLRVTDRPEDGEIMRGLLHAVALDGARSQRGLASDLGIALGLLNAYLKRCVKKGLVKVHDAPARRYIYYLTPQGFAEKSRLTVQYLSDSFGFFRLAKTDCARVFEAAKSKGFTRVVLAGKSDLAEIAILCALEFGVTIAAIVDPRGGDKQFSSIKLVKTYGDVRNEFDAVIVTDVTRAKEFFLEAVEVIGAERVFVPSLLGLNSVEAVGGK